MLDVGTRLDRRIVSPTAGTINMSSHQGLGWITASSGDTFDWRTYSFGVPTIDEGPDIDRPPSLSAGADRGHTGARCTVHGLRGRWLGDTRAYGALRQVESDKGFLERSDDATTPSGVREPTTSRKALGTFPATFAKSRSSNLDVGIARLTQNVKEYTLLLRKERLFRRNLP